MNKLLSGLLILSFATACGVFNKSNAPVPSIYEFSSSITQDLLYADLAVLADDSLSGRETGTEGLQKAARYLSERYEALGLEAVGDNGTYYQKFDLVQPVTNGYIYTLTNDGETIDQSVMNADKSGNFYTVFGGTDDVEGEIVFAGYGAFDEANGINQFPEDVTGKWIMLIAEDGVTNMGRMQQLVRGGAVGALIITEPTNPMAYESDADAMKSRMGNTGRLSLKYMQSDNGSVSPAYNYVHPEMATKILGMSDLNEMQSMVEQIRQDPASFNAMSTGYMLAHSADIDEQTITTQNVVAFIEGSDPELKDEVVVLSSHYDHVGIGRPDSTGDNIYNGADDDGSGTVATLHTAQAMMAAKKAGAGPSRSILFLHVSGEEKGLLGSRYYSDHPIYAIDNTVANVNIDMIGRIDPKYEGDDPYIYIIGGEIISSGLDSLSRAANEMGPNLTLSKKYNDLNDPNRFYRRSDHWNFGRLGVPFVFFFNGTHEDYHRPSDELDKIAWEQYTQRTQLVYNLTALISESDERPVVDNQEFIEATQVQPRN
ncbi:M28 family peptidase [Balneola sp. MJW-20]|uniref:M28 family peptidase n=1 Tax=Gracilimonas aurantiaca TaxID=3234185 RepID=UPI0034671BAA